MTKGRPITPNNFDRVYYRYDGYKYADIAVYRVVRKTDKGVWIRLGYNDEKFILDGARKRWAYPTKEDALESFRIRKLRQIEHCREGEERAIQGLKKVGFNTDKELKSFFGRNVDFDWGI